MKRTPLIYTWFLLLVTICCSKNVFPQQANAYSFEFFNSSHGLPSSEIISLAKDSKGFLWIGTAAGLSRYDGYAFHNYTRTSEDDPVGFINVLKFDEQDRLWIGADAGLFCLVKNVIIKISAESSLAQGVNDILLDKDGVIWLATENGPAKIHINQVDFNGSKKLPLVQHILPGWLRSVMDVTAINHIAKARDGTIYIADPLRLFRLNDDKPELLHTVSRERDYILSIFPVSRTKVYFNAVHTEIHLVENGIHTNIQHKTLYQPGVDGHLEGIWFQGTFGMYYFHPQTGIASRFINTSDNGVIWPSTMLKEDNFFWTASHNGLVKVKPSLFSYYNTYFKEYVPGDYYSLLHLQNGKLLLGSNWGRLIEKTDTGFSLRIKNIVPAAEIKCLYENDDGSIWAGTGYQGLALVQDKKITIFTTKDGLHDNSFSSFLRTKDNRLYAIGDHGLTQVIVDNDKKISFKKHYHPSGIARHSKFFSGIEAPDGSVWIGGEEGLFQLKDDSLRHFAINRRRMPAKYIVKDQNGSVWIATDGDGVMQCTFDKQHVLQLTRQFTQADGLNTLHYLALLVDKQDNIWAGSSKGLTFIGTTGKYKDHILNFDETDGFIKPGYFSICLYQDRHDRIWAGTSFGFTSFRPGEMELSATAPIMHITGVRQIKTNQLQDIDGRRTFAYNSNSINFNFTALDYANQEGMRYYYKLQGRDTGWINAGNQRSISYESLPPGNYTFHVKALNSKGEWSRADATYAFTITQPFWKQWWFILLYTILLVVLVVFFVRARIASIRKKEAEQTALQKLKAAAYRERLEIEQIINHFAMSMNSVNSVEELLWNVVQNCISRLNFEDCVIYLKEEGRDMLVQKAAWGPKTTTENRIINPLGIPFGKGIVGHVAATGKALVVSDTSLDERYIVDDTRRNAELAVPIISNGQVIGVIDSEHTERHFYSERHVQVLTTIAALCADKINTIKAGQQAREKEIEVLRLSKDFATSQLTALRTQMNPHFIFNALNSIQHYILQGNVVDANRYLSKFSKLQRDILHCSNQQFITLEKELEILHAYLQLEQYRFGENFNYKISMTEEIEPVEISIPPMILQPFVENAIWHGLMPRQTDRMLSIYFDLHTDDILVATLRDNGIGRAASARLKQGNGEQKNAHASKGMSMVQQRLQLLQQQYEKPFELTVADITDTRGEVQGTEVTLKIYIGNKKI